MNYVIEQRIEGTFKWTRASVGDVVTSLTWVVRGLRTDEKYEFRVAAENRAGVGLASDPTAPTRAKTPIRKHAHNTEIYM